MNKDKFAKTIDDDQLDQVAGGCFMPRDDRDAFEDAKRILKNVNRKGEVINSELPNQDTNIFEDSKPIVKTY